MICKNKSSLDVLHCFEECSVYSCTLSDVVRLTTINAAQLQCSTVNSPLNAAHPPVVKAEDERSYHHFESRPCRIILVVHAYDA